MVSEKTTINQKRTVGIVGIGYVGLPVAMGFSEKYHVIGFDVNKNKISDLKKNQDPTGQFTHHELKTAHIHFSSDEKLLNQCDYIVVCVPTPLTLTNEPDLTNLRQASEMIGQNLTPHTTVIFESTVFPGTTEDICIPILEKHSNLKSTVDFHVGYSPERINPGDQQHTFKNISKIVSGQDRYALEKTFGLYHSILDAEVFRASSIKVAEAAKVIENTQRDVNIALMNEFSIICNRLNIDTYDVLAAAKTKWNFIPLTPGLVGGHCIGVDPYYLIHKSKMEGYDPQLLSKAREINDSIPVYIVQTLLALMVSRKLNPNDVEINLLGVTFKEDTPDLRNSKSLEILENLQKLGLKVNVSDPYADPDYIKKQYNIHLKHKSELQSADIVIVAVPHKEFDAHFIHSLLGKKHGILLDLKGVVPKEMIPRHIMIWRL